LPKEATPAALPLPLFDDGADVATPAPQGVELPPIAEEERDDEANAHARHDFARYLLALGRVKGIGIRTLRLLMDHYGDLAHVWDDDVPAIRDLLARAKVADSRSVATLIKSSRHRLLEDGQREAEALGRRGIQVLSRQDLWFPQQLADLPDAPYWLFVEGDPFVLTGRPFIAVIGTRDASRAGRMAAARVTREIVLEGVGVISGLAEGIDAVAHGTAALYGARQVAVLGTGINSVFPSSTAGLRRRIVESGGAVITEYMPNERYGKAQFVQRNRIQAGLAAAVCPVEGKAQSGSAHTVRFAHTYGRLMFGVRCGRPSGDNELLEGLVAEQAPVFDLDTDEGQWGLERLLKGLPGERWPKPTEPDPAVLFQGVIKELDNLESDLGLTPMLARWFLQYVAQRYGFSTRRLESVDGR
jgi:DNA protecting protein DprA